MDATTTGALRVVLNVTEVSAVAEMERMRANTERMMKAYHFQQTMCAYSRAVLTKVNAWWNATATPMTFDEFVVINNMDEGDYDGPQYKVNIFSTYDVVDDENDVMAFVEPTLHPEGSYLRGNSLPGDGTLPLADLESLANFLGDHPDVYDGFMNKIMYMEIDENELSCDTPSNGIVCF